MSVSSPVRNLEVGTVIALVTLQLVLGADRQKHYFSH